MKNQIYNVLNDMAEYLYLSQMKHLQEVLIKRLEECSEDVEVVENHDYVEMCLSAKLIEGCSERTINYYRSTLCNLFNCISDINFEERTFIVFGKGDKERRVYFDAKTKLHLKKYL